MATSVLKSPFLRAAANLSYSTQAAINPSPAAACVAEVKYTSLPNKLSVVSVENYSPISRVSILFRAGSRYETHDSAGSTHLLRVATGLSTKGYTHFGIIRNIKQIGGNICATSDREIIAYTLEATRDKLEVPLNILGHVATQQVFKPWEISDNIARVKYDLLTISPTVRTLDLLHKAAYRTGLGNSIFCPKHLVGKISSETLQHFVKSNFTSNRAAVVGVGIDHDRLLAFAQNLLLESGEGPASASKYGGGEIRLENGSSLTNVAVVAQGASWQNTNEALAFAVLQYALGVAPSVKWGSQCTSPLGKAVSGSNVQNHTFAVSAINVSYSDGGLFGFLASCDASIAGTVVESAVKQLRSGNVSEADIMRGKAQLKTSMLMSLESGAELAAELGTQSLISHDVTPVSKIIQAIDGLSSSDVNAAAKKVAGGKLSLAAVGNLSKVPHVDELK